MTKKHVISYPNEKNFLRYQFYFGSLARGPEYSIIAKKVLDKGSIKDYMFCVSFLSVADFAYITRKGGNERLKENIDLICDLFNVLSNDRKHLLKAWTYNPKDYEDSVQYATAILNQCNIIITRNAKDFYFSEIPILTPQEFIDTL
ncbi:MAG: hypothetical protein J1F67_11135 [Muribaculaceae bacterium]|nr:hypothetical protein [Muribaculaceae bacterium]